MANFNPENSLQKNSKKKFKKFEMEHIFESNSSANADQETSYQDLSYPVENQSFAHSGFQGTDSQNSHVKSVFQLNQSLPSPPPTPMGLKNIADVLDPQKNPYSSQMNSNFLNYHHHMNGGNMTYPMIPRYGYDSDHMTAAAAVAAAQSQNFFPQEPSINNMSMESLISPEIRYQDMMRVPMINTGKMISAESISDGKVYKCQKPNCSKVNIFSGFWILGFYEKFPVPSCLRVCRSLSQVKIFTLGVS